jgi:hypothetical protein
MWLNLKEEKIRFETDLTTNETMYEELSELTKKENLSFAKKANLKIMKEILEKHPSLKTKERLDELRDLT